MVTATDEEKERHRAVVSVRQAAEWSVRDLRGAYPRLRTTLTLTDYQRRLLFEGIIKLNNYRTFSLGLSQVRTVFEASLVFNHQEFFNI